MTLKKQRRRVARELKKFALPLPVRAKLGRESVNEGRGVLCHSLQVACREAGHLVETSTEIDEEGCYTTRLVVVPTGRESVAETFDY